MMAKKKTGKTVDREHRDKPCPLWIAPVDSKAACPRGCKNWQSVTNASRQSLSYGLRTKRSSPRRVTRPIDCRDVKLCLRTQGVSEC